MLKIIIDNYYLNYYLTTHNYNYQREFFMKMVTTIIKPFKLDDVREALSKIRDGKIFVSSLQIIRIRTGETDKEALQ